METEEQWAARMSREEPKAAATWQRAYDKGYADGRDGEANYWLAQWAEIDNRQKAGFKGVTENLLPYLKAMKAAVETSGECDTLSPEHYHLWLHLTADVDWLIELAEDIAADLEISDGS